MYNHKNFFFDRFGSANEQNLLDDLITECISIHGEDVLYIPRKLNNYDPLYTADDSSSYEDTYPLVMYIENFDSFEGQRDSMTKFGLEINDQVTFVVSRRVFDEEVSVNTGQIRPNEGDAIFFPLNHRVFKISYVEKFEMFYPLGKLYTWKLQTELFDYSGEKFNTGIPEIDALEVKNDTNILDFALTTENGDYITDESGNYLTVESFSTEQKVSEAINQNLEDAAERFVKYTPDDPFAEGRN